MSDADGPAPRELPLLVGGAGEAEALVLIGEPRDGKVVVRRWSGDAWSATAQTRTEDADALLRWIEAQAQRGRTLNQSLYGVRLWLRGDGTAPGLR